MTSFSSLSLSAPMLENLEKLNYTTMTEIQAASIPAILEGRDVLAQAKTGSGKTAAFGIGLLHNLNADRYRVQALVLCPTRELADQVAEELRRVARFKHNLKILSLTGGVPMRKQEHSLKHQAHITVGTPGRILKLLQRSSLILDEVTSVVLDEADRMLDMGFMPQIKDILRFAPKKRQTLCFSATFPDAIKQLSKSVQNHPEEIVVESQHEPAVIAQQFLEVHGADKTRAVMQLLAQHRPESTLIFCNTKEQCRRLRSDFNKAGIPALALHGDLDQKERTETLIRFSNKSCAVLIATDVAARGIDVEELRAVINFELPFEPEGYVHRIGRTGRAGSTGRAFSLVNADDGFRVDDINQLMQTQFKVSKMHIEAEQTLSNLEAPMVTISLNGGRKNKISAGDILGALTAKGRIAGDEVGKIDRLDNLTFVAIKRAAAARAFEVLQSSQIKGRRFTARVHD